MQLELRVENESNNGVNLSWLRSRYVLSPGESVEIDLEDTRLFEGNKSKSKIARNTLNDQINSGQISATVITDLAVDTSGKKVEKPVEKPKPKEKSINVEQEAVINAVNKNAEKTPDGFSVTRSETAEESERVMTPKHSSIASAKERTLDLTSNNMPEAQAKQQETAAKAIDAANSQAVKAKTEKQATSENTKTSTKTTKTTKASTKSTKPSTKTTDKETKTTPKTTSKIQNKTTSSKTESQT